MNICIFGKPRSGKTTLEAYFIDKHFKRKKRLEKFPKLYPFLCKFLPCKMPYKHIFSNDKAFIFDDVIYYDIRTLGMWKPVEHSLVLMTEAGINLSNRNTLTLSEYAERFFAYYGHLKLDLIYDSQADDVDIKLRNRTDYFYLVKKFGDNPNSVVQEIQYNLDVNHETHKVEEMYDYNSSFLWKILYRLVHKRFTLHRKKYYKYFDSWYDDFDYPMSGPDDMFGYNKVLALQKAKHKKIRR